MKRHLNTIIALTFSAVCFQTAFATEMVTALDSDCSGDCVALSGATAAPITLDIGYKYAKDLKAGDVIKGEQDATYTITDVAHGKNFTVVKGDYTGTFATTPAASTTSPAGPDIMPMPAASTTSPAGPDIMPMPAATTTSPTTGAPIMKDTSTPGATTTTTTTPFTKVN